MGPAGYFHLRPPVRASRAQMCPVDMYIVPFTTTGVPCIHWPTVPSGCTIQAAPRRSRLNLLIWESVE
jgi:hypothetical protein